MKIALIGTYPPPIGGTSIHISRLREMLVKDGYDVIVYDTHGTGNADFEKFVSIKNYKKWIIVYALKMSEDIIHSHTHDWKERAILSFFARLHNKISIFTFHSLRDEYTKFSFIQKLYVKIAIKYASGFICTSENILTKLLEWGCPQNKLFYSCPFIAPTDKEKQEKPLPIFSEYRKKHHYILSANASNTNKYNNQDLYGLDMCIEAVKYLVDKGYDVGLIYALTQITDIDFFNEIRERINDLGITNNVLLFTEKTGLIPILTLSDAFLRPTNTDSWAMSISESITLGIPVIASNVCKREKGAILFESRNQCAFNKAIEKCLRNLSIEKEKLKHIVVESHHIEVGGYI